MGEAEVSGSSFVFLYIYIYLGVYIYIYMHFVSKRFIRKAIPDASLYND